MCSSRTRTTVSSVKKGTSDFDRHVSRSLVARALTVAIGFAGLAIAGCPSKAPEDPVGMSHVETPEPITGSAIDFAFESLDARQVSSSSMRGKITVLAFVTTYDLGSQAQVNFLVAMAKHDGEKVNYVLVALEKHTERELVEVYKNDLNVKFPVALADEPTIGGGGPFGDVHKIPAVVVLDQQGQMVWKKTGLSKSEEIRTAMRRL